MDDITYARRAAALSEEMARANAEMTVAKEPSEKLNAWMAYTLAFFSLVALQRARSQSREAASVS